MAMRKRSLTGLAAVLGLSTLTASAVAGEEKIAPEKLPSAVQKAVKKHFPGARYRTAIKEEADGKTTYEVELTVEGRAVDANLSPEGKVLAVEKEVAADDLPGPVKKALAAKYPGARITKAEALTEGVDGPVRYEVAIQGTEVVLTPKGKIVPAAAKDEDDEKPAAKAGSKKDKEDDDDEDEDDDR